MGSLKTNIRIFICMSGEIYYIDNNSPLIQSIYRYTNIQI